MMQETGKSLGSYERVIISQIHITASGSCAKKQKNNKQDASLFLPVVALPYLSPSLFSIHCMRKYQWATAKCHMYY